MFGLRLRHIVVENASVCSDTGITEVGTVWAQEMTLIDPKTSRRTNARRIHIAAPRKRPPPWPDAAEREHGPGLGYSDLIGKEQELL